MIDNYDSFTYNLVQYLLMLGAEVKVVRNDAFTLEDVRAWKPWGIVISPGPGRPHEAGLSLDVVKTFSGEVPLLGVCLGHQAMGLAFGATIVKARHLMHGKVSLVHHDGRGVYRGLPNPFEAMRYHSLAVAREGFPESLEITATADDGEIMGLRHRTHPTEGIQFHPESIMTQVGKRLLRNFVRVAERL
jgi:anthranilate synthase component 2